MCIVREVRIFLRYFDFLQELVKEMFLKGSGPRPRVYTYVGTNVLVMSGFKVKSMKL